MQDVSSLLFIEDSGQMQKAIFRPWILSGLDYCLFEVGCKASNPWTAQQIIHVTYLPDADSQFSQNNVEYAMDSNS